MGKADVGERNESEVVLNDYLKAFGYFFRADIHP